MDAGDLDGDGDLDVASAESDVQWHENDGSPADGGWTAHALPAATGTVSGFPTDARVGDIDQDGDLDVIASYLSLTPDDGLIAWWENDGTPGDGGWSEHDIDDTLTDPRAIRVGDLDGDGDLDVAGVSQNGGQIWWWRNTSGGATWSSELSVSALIGPSGLDLGDFDRDGSLDVASSDAFGNVTVHRNTAGDGSSWSLATVRTGSEASAFIPTAADLDGDGDLDLAVANNPAGKAIWLENNGTLVNWPERSLSSAFSGASAAAAGDLDADGDIDLAVIGGNGVDGEIRLWLNHGGSFALATTDTAPGSIANGMADDLLKVEATHRGRSGDGDVELTSFELLLEDGSGTPLSDGEAGALFDGVDVYRDDGSESFDGADTLVGSEPPPFDLQGAGRLAVSFADDLAELRVELGTPRTYFVVADLSAGASGASPNTFRIRHDTEASSTGEDADHDIPLRLEYAENVSSGSVTSTGTACYLLTLGKVGNGSVPAVNPTGSSGCSSGLYLAAESIQVTAAPLHSGYVVLAWSGTDNDASTSLMNSLTMPATSSAVTVTYGLADDLVLTAESYSSAALREACNSITAGTAVVVQTGGDVTYSAPAAILLTNGFEVQSGSFIAELATPAECP
jgi:hypothetical protein